MLPQFERMERICRQLQTAIDNNDNVMRYRLTLVLLVLILKEHEQLEKIVSSIESDSTNNNTLPTKYKCTQHIYHRGGHGFGHSSRSSHSYWSGRSGDILKPMTLVDSVSLSKQLIDIRQKQIEVNNRLTVLKQYADQWIVHRDSLLECKPRNIQQRSILNLLMTTDVRHSGDYNPVLNVVSGFFWHSVRDNLHTITKLLKGLTDRKNNIGRQSLKAGRQIVNGIRNDKYKNQFDPFPRYSDLQSKNVRCYSVQSYVSNSKLYQSRLGWVVGIREVSQCLPIMPYVDQWKRDYKATDKLSRLQAVNRKPYVLTIVTSKPVVIDYVELAETRIPIYRAECILPLQDMVKHVCYYIGKTGSTVWNNSIKTIEWLHTEVISDHTTERVLEIFNARLRYLYSSAQTAKQKRKETAAYARKLVWLETISMLDSKNAGNCLPGTLQFCNDMNIPTPTAWSNYTVDARMLLRRWKQKGYETNRLFYSAIDKVVNRVKQQLLSVTACYVPSVISNGVK